MNPIHPPAFDQGPDPSINPFIPTPVVASDDIGPLPADDKGLSDSAYQIALCLCDLIPDADVEQHTARARAGRNYPPSLSTVFPKAIANSGVVANALNSSTLRREAWQIAAINGFFRKTPAADPFPPKGTRTSQCFTRIEPDGTTVAVLRIVESDGAQWQPTGEPDLVTPCQRASDLDKQRPGRKPSTKNPA